MYQFLRKNLNKVKYQGLSGVVIILLILLTVVYGSGDKSNSNLKTTNNIYEAPDLKTLKEFLLSQIKSPFTNINYEIKSGDSIQKILNKLNVEKNDIQKVINEYKKYSNPNKLFVGNKINITIEENISKKKNSVVKFTLPITKSTTIEITKNNH